LKFIFSSPKQVLSMVNSINTLIKLNKKFAYVKLNAKNPAIDIATKLGMI